jgi:hypothetical protein
MRFPGIVACILAVVAACAPCQALNATASGTAAAHSSAPAPTRIAKAKNAKKAEQPPQQSYITFYWSKGLEGSSLFNVFRERLVVSVDGQPAGKLSQGEYVSIPVQPGHHTYGYERVAISSEGEIKREIDVAPGQSVYFEIVEKSEAGLLHTITPQEVPAGQAQAELTHLKTSLQAGPQEASAGAPGAPGPQAMPGAPGVPGTAASTPQPGGKPGKKGAAPPPVQQSFIVFYWPNRGGSVSLLSSLKEHFGVGIDDQAAGSFSEGQYIAVPVQPGAHTYSYARASQVSFSEKKHPVDIAPGQSVYFEIAEEQRGMVTVLYPQQVPAEQGQPALAGLKQPGKDD